MQIVFISAMATSPWGGSEELWSQAALQLHKQGHQVSALVPWWPQPAAQLKKLSELGIVVRMCAPSVAGLGGRVWRRLTRRFQLLNEDCKWILGQRPDFVCVSNGNYGDGLEYLEFCATQGLPYASVVQANLESIWPSDLQAERLIRVYQEARRAFFVSRRNRELLETQLGIELPNAEVVRNPFNVRWDASVPWPPEKEGWRLACVARLDPSAKGQDLLFEVMASEQWRSRPVTLSVFGRGEMAQGLRRLAARLKIEDRVLFRGHVANIEQLWTEHHALVLPSRYEGLPLALVEAMLCARPAIVTDVAGNTELVEDGATGFVAAAPTVEHLNTAMERAWERRTLWKAMGLAAQLKVRSEVPANPAEVFADRLLELARAAR